MRMRVQKGSLYAYAEITALGEWEKRCQKVTTCCLLWGYRRKGRSCEGKGVGWGFGNDEVSWIAVIFLLVHQDP